MGEWEFYRIPGSGTEDAPFPWSWKCKQPDGRVLTTPDTFRFFLDCVAHARQHGYSNGPLHTRREANETASTPQIRLIPLAHAAASSQ